MHARAWCEIDLDGLRDNVKRLREVAGVPLVPMVKADAYGLGAEALTRVFTGLPERYVPWALGVATVAEGEALRAYGWAGRVLCVSPVLTDEHAAMRTSRITPSLHRAQDITAWCHASHAPWHLAIDTGMSRAGISWREVASLVPVVAAQAPEGVFTHFHSALAHDGSRAEQEARFRAALHVLALPAPTLRHADNSHALATRATSASEEGGAWDLARPGIALYGSPAESELRLRPVLHVYARVVDVRDVAVGDTVGYDATWTATRPSRIATVGIGYGDGYRRSLSNAGEMLLHGRRVPVAGLISMDLTMLDVTDATCTVGDVVTVLGQSPDEASATLTIDEVASRGGLSPYELLVGWRVRLPRVYRERT